MKVLVVCSFKEGCEGHIAPFVKEQMDAVRRQGVACECFLVKGNGVVGYLDNLKALKKMIGTFHPDVVHAHYGLCGLLANLQRKVPVVTTYHGTDINSPRIRRFSRIAIRWSRWNVFVSRNLMDLVNPGKRSVLLPCGVELSDLQLTERLEARKLTHLDEAKRYVLFAGAFDNPVKNASLAKQIMALLGDEAFELLELKGYSRDEVTLLMCAADALLMTSDKEGSPQVVKEALACGCPIVSVNVGDVKERTQGVEGCYVADTREPQELAQLLAKALAFEGKTKGRDKIVADGLNQERVAQALIEVYSKTKKS